MSNQGIQVEIPVFNYRKFTNRQVVSLLSVISEAIYRNYTQTEKKFGREVAEYSMSANINMVYPIYGPLLVLSSCKLLNNLYGEGTVPNSKMDFLRDLCRKMNEEDYSLSDEIIRDFYNQG